MNENEKIARQPGVRATTVDGRLVVQNQVTNGAFSLDAIGSRIWVLIEQPRTIDELVDELASEFAVTPSECRGDVVAFITHLIGSGLARKVSEGTGEAVAQEAVDAVDTAAIASESLERIAALCDWLHGDLAVFAASNSAPHRPLLAEAQAVIIGAAARLGAIHAKLQAARDDHLATEWQSIRGRFGERELKINLGSGRTPLEGWVNLDIRPADACVDFRGRFPLPDDCARLAYSAHVLEHLDYPADALHFLRECFRVLAPGAVLRLVVPDIGRMMAEYAAGERGFFLHYARIRSADTTRTPLEQLLSYAGARRSALRPFSGHRFGYDAETLEKLLGRAGFIDVTRRTFMDSSHRELQVDAASQVAALNYGDLPYSLFVEASTPAEKRR